MGLPDAESVSDIQRLYMILAPSARPAADDGGDAAQPKPKARLVVVAKKVLPDPKRHDRFFGFVQVLADSYNLPYPTLPKNILSACLHPNSRILEHGSDREV